MRNSKKFARIKVNDLPIPQGLSLCDESCNLRNVADNAPVYFSSLSFL
jgi:hypothetical protein